MAGGADDGPRSADEPAAAGAAAPGILRRSVRRVTGRETRQRERETRRRRQLGPEERITEDVVAAVQACEPVWDLLAQKDLTQDASVRELDLIRRTLLGRPPRPAEVVCSVSLRSDDARQVEVVRSAIPGAAGPVQVNSYRYATLTSGAGSTTEPFVVALHCRDDGVNDVVASMFVDATFLRHEQEFGCVPDVAVRQLERVVRADLLAFRATHEALLRA